MALKRRRSRASFSPGLIFGWVGAIVAIALLGVAGTGLAHLRSERADRDLATLCTSKTPPAITALLFDSSDSLSELQQIKVQQILDDKLQNISKGERVDVYMATAQSGQLARPLFSRCSPSGAGGAAGWSENPERVLALQRTKFIQPLEQAIEKTMRANPRKTSPILETIAAASVLSFGRSPSGGEIRDGKATLVIISDFLQNSAILTQYKAFPDVEEFSEMPGWIQTKPALRDVYIVMIYINRGNTIHVQTKKQKEWWCKYFIKRGVTDCVVEEL